MENDKDRQSEAEWEMEGGAVATSPEDELAEEVAALKQELETVRQKADENLDGWQRAQAEFSNYKKRQEKEQTAQRDRLAGDILKRYLEVVDDLDRALAKRPQDGAGAEWASGMDLIYRKMLAILESEGVTVMQAEGEHFDPNRHEAISQEESPEHESGQIIEVLQKGYLLGERVLRPARVRIAK